jgi:hypothetical protein
MDNPFRRRPYLDLEIDVWKVLFLAFAFLFLLGWLAYSAYA